MEKEQYITNKKEIETKINDLRIELKNLNNQYISSKTDFSSGERVKVFTPERKASFMGKPGNELLPEKTRFAYFERYEIDYSGDLVPILSKEKKDGTPSKIRDYVGGAEMVLKIN